MKTAIVIGDAMVDEYVTVDVSRISPEAPVPVMRILGREYRSGGAANVAEGIRALGVDARLLSVIGLDDPSKMLIKYPGRDTILCDSTRPTTLKTRYVTTTGQQIARADLESCRQIERAQEDQLRVKMEAITRAADVGVIVLSDYAKGVLTRDLIGWVIRVARSLKIPVIVDPKRPLEIYDGATIATPNERELGDHDPQDLVDDRTFDFIVVTRGANGMTCYGREMLQHTAKNEVHQVADVTGAGDTVVAAIASYVCETPPDLIDVGWMLMIASRCAGIAVTKRGTSVVTLEEVGDWRK